MVEVQRFAAAVDHDLRAACRAEATARLALGAIARQLLRRRGHRRLGFVRLADYARERLGISARALESAAHVAERLDDLPAIRAAFEAGELSWSKLRMLADVACIEDERAWLEQARRGSAAELASSIEAARGQRVATTTFDDPDAETIDGEEAAVWRIACPGRVRALWRRACELASRLSGGPIAGWQAAELVAAEGIASRPPGTSIGDRVLLALLRVDRQRRRRAASVTAPGRSTDGAGAPPPLPAPDPTLGSGGLQRATLGDDPFDLDARLREAVDRLRTIEPEMGRLLRLVVDHRLHRALGARSLSEYTREHLGISLRKVWALVKIERRVRSLAPLASAYDHGRLSWVRALTLLPVVDRTNVDQWIARAEAVTVRRLTDEVAHVLDRRDLLGADTSLAPPPIDDPLSPVQVGAHGGPQPAWTQNVTGAGSVSVEMVDGEIRFAAPATVVALLRDALEAYALPGEARWVALECMLRRVVTDWESEPGHSDPVFHRDGWRCAVPACSGRRNLHDHHIRFRSQGGGNERENRVTVCAAHHLHGIHAGHVRARGAVPWVRWDLGVRPDAPPLVSYEGRDRLAKL